MSSTRLHGALRIANPIPDPEVLLVDEADARAFLRNVQERRDGMATEPISGVRTIDRERASDRRGWTLGPRRRRWAMAVAAFVLLAGVAVGALLMTDDPSNVAASPLEVAEEYAELRSRGELIAAAALKLDASQPELDHAAGLEVWNVRGERTGPCREQRVANVFRCEWAQYDDFHAAAGISPYTVVAFVTVNEAGEISELEVGINEIWTHLHPFQAAFMEWIRVAHPEEALQMSGIEQDPTDTEIALRFVDEFVAQSDRYPISR